MRAALSSMHEEPARGWTVQGLAHTVGMSRTAFAQTFKRFVGSSPMEYLTKWRMTLAAKRIQETGESIASLAPVLGYQSESAFSAAFKRQWGVSPREYVRARRLESRTRLMLVEQHIQEGLVHTNPAVVLDEAECSEPIHEVADS